MDDPYCPWPPNTTWPLEHCHVFGDIDSNSNMGRILVNAPVNVNSTSMANSSRLGVVA